MNRARPRTLARPLSLRRLTAGLWAAGLPLLGLGCIHTAKPPAEKLVLVSLTDVPNPQPGAGRENAPETAHASGQPARAAEGAIRQVRADEPASQLPPIAGAAVKQLPINLDTVLRMAGDQNRQIALARERVSEAQAEQDAACKAWLPDVYVGPSYYRHEGGIQAVNGNLVHSSFGALFSGLELHGRLDVREATFLKVNAERKVWQQKGELSRITNETLLDAASTYLDLLLARSSAATVRQTEKLLTDLLDTAQKFAKTEPQARVQVESMLAEIRGNRQAVARMNQQGDAASAKLVYLLGLDPCTELVPVDDSLVAFELINADVPACELVAQAMANGPGVAELEKILAVMNNGIEHMKGPAALMPTLEMRMAEGGFFAGPGSHIGGDNRWDLNLQARWNLTGLLAARHRQKVVHSKLEQVHLTHQDLQAKLAAGVQEAREAIQSGRVQIAWGKEQIHHARETHRLSDVRQKQAKAQDKNFNEVQQSIRFLGLAELNQLQTISAFDKAQLRLMLLLGPASCDIPPDPVLLPAAGPERLPYPQEKKP